MSLDTLCLCETVCCMKGVVVLLLSHCIICSSGVSVWISLADFNLWKWNTVYSTLCSVRAIAPSMAASSQPALHMTAGFGIKERKLWGRQRQAPSDEMLSLLSGGLGEVLLYSRHALHLHLRRSADALVQGDSLVTQVGGRCIAQGLVDRSRRSWRTHADSNWWPFSFRKDSSKLRYNSPSLTEISLNKQEIYFINLCVQTDKRLKMHPVDEFLMNWKEKTSFQLSVSSVFSSFLLGNSHISVASV